MDAVRIAGPGKRFEIRGPVFGKIVVFDPTEKLDLPLGWKKIPSGMVGAAFKNDRGLTVLMSGLVLEGKRWIHVSVSRKSRLPSWEELKAVKNIFIGMNRKAIQVLPAWTEYVNFHKYCLHLWHCPDGDGIPDFTLGKKMI